jgi:surfeit locus 1 family protein
MYRFLRSPRWVAGHVLVLVTVVTFASLGLWQLRRLEDRQAHNALLADRIAQPAVDLASSPLDTDDLAYRPVELSGTYLHDQEVLLSTRSQRGQPGHHILTPLRTSDGDVVVVDRGWVPLELDDPPVAQAAPPSGEVRVEGLLFPSVPARRSGALDGSDAALQFVSHVDLEVLGAALGTDVYPLYVLAREQRPPQADLPRPAEPPALTEGNHLSYAVQWFLFAAVVVVGYPLLLRRTARDERHDDTRQTQDAPAPVP